MATAKFCDNYSSTLSAGYTSGGTSLSVASAGTGDSTLPTSGDYYVIVEAEGGNTTEVFKVSSRSGTTLTVVGAQAGTSASDHANGATIKGAILTGSAMRQARTDAVRSMTASALDALSGDERFGLVRINDGHHDAIWNGSDWEYYDRVDGTRCYPVDNSAFSWINQDSASVTMIGKSLHFSRAGGGGDSIRLRAKTISLTPPYQLTAQFWPELNVSGAFMAGIWIGESGSTPKVHTHMATYNSSYAFRSYKWTNPTTYAGSVTYTETSDFGPVYGKKVWLRIKHDGTNLIFYTSPNGNVFYSLNSSTVGATSFLANVSQWGLVLNSALGGASIPVGQLVYSFHEEQL